MNKLLLLLALAAVANAGVMRFTGKHVAKPIVRYGVVKPAKIVKRVLW